jgi:hypothetical protein
MILETGAFAAWRLFVRILPGRGPRLPARISHHAGKLTNSVPLLGTSSAERNLLPRHCLFQAVAHGGEKCKPAAAVSWAFLFVLWFSASVVARAEDRVQAELDQVAKMTAPEQQAWLQQLEKRAAQAARATLAPKEAARQEARTSSLLHQKKVTWKVLREVIEDTEACESATEAAAKPKAVEKTAVAKPQAAKKRTKAAKPQAAAVKIDVEELETRIAAANLELRELEADLAEKTTWTAAKLDPLFDRLKTLVVGYEDLGLFRDVLPKKQQAEVTTLEAPKAAIAQLSARVVEARKRANDPKFVGDEVERRAELTRLETISHRLAELAGK